MEHMKKYNITANNVIFGIIIVDLVLLCALYFDALHAAK